MPQLFQVLKCYKCSVFQNNPEKLPGFIGISNNRVHQTKKSNKWECKLCGEKQSIKRHYGLGTGKECRLHVQKLNSIRGEVDKINETANSETSDEEDLDTSKKKVPYKKQENAESKWSEFVEETEDIKVLIKETNKPMFFENVEVVLDVPAKRRKLSNGKGNRNVSVLNAHSSKTDEFNNFTSSRRSPSPPPIKFYETIVPKLQKEVPNMTLVKSNDTLIKNGEIDAKETIKQPVVTTFAPLKVKKNSKWAQFSNESDEENFENECNLEILTNQIDTNNGAVNKGSDLEECIIKNYASFHDDEEVKKKAEDLKGGKNVKTEGLSNIFALCDEKDLDDVLDF